MTDPAAVTLTPAERAICAKIAAEITEHPERWTQGVIARSGFNFGTSADDPTAVCWCAYGFIVRSFPGDDSAERITDAFEMSIGRSIVDFNDWREREPSEVAAVFAKLAEAPQS